MARRPFDIIGWRCVTRDRGEEPERSCRGLEQNVTRGGSPRMIRPGAAPRQWVVGSLEQGVRGAHGGSLLISWGGRAHASASSSSGNAKRQLRSHTTPGASAEACAPSGSDLAP